MVQRKESYQLPVAGCQFFNSAAGVSYRLAVWFEARYSLLGLQYANQLLVFGS